MHERSTPWLLALLLVACSDSGQRDPGDGSGQTAGMTGAPAGSSAAGSAAAGNGGTSGTGGRPPVVEPLDAASPSPDDAATATDAAQQDASTDPGDAGPDATLDAGTPTTTAAIAGERCPVQERVALVEVNLIAPGDAAISTRIYDRVHPWLAPPEIVRGACVFHRFTQAFCPVACAPDELCGREPMCFAAPRLRRDASLVITVDGTPYTFDADATTGELFGTIIDVGAASFWATLTLGEHTVTLDETPFATGLINPTGVLEGDYSVPAGLDLSWDGPSSGHAYTLIPINHHAGGPTFTECTAPVADGTIHVDGDMLLPLAISTGLEFQTLGHVHFAAAHTPVGCVELRSTVEHYLNF